MEEVDETKRKTRNLCEKKRRDQFNMLVNELSVIVSSNGRKMDKSTVLKSTITFLKNHNETTVRSRLNDIKEEWKPSFISNEEFTHLILDALDAFIMVFSGTGHVKFVSESVTSILGHLPTDIMNKSLFDLAYDEVRPGLYSLLQNPRISVESMQSVVINENQIQFQCHIRRGSLDASDEPVYELVQFIGYFRSNVEMEDKEEGTEENNSSRLLFVCTGRLQLPLLIRDMTPVMTDTCEFTSRHSLEWKYLFLDHRAPSIIGYLPFEVLGTSGYDYYHLDDLEKVAMCHEALMEKGELTSCYYRFLTKGQQWIWLQTRFYITYHQWNSKPELVVCTHRVVSYADVMDQTNNDSVNDQPSCSQSQPADDVINEEEMSMEGGSPSCVSEGSVENEGHGISHTGSTLSFSTGSGAEGNGSPYSNNTCNAVSASTSAASSNASQVSQSHFNSRTLTRAARIRYGCSEFGSIPSTSTALRRCDPQDPQTSSASDATVRAYTEPLQHPYPLPPPVVVSHSYFNIQDHFQRKHEELQQMIVMQQEELRRISHQLIMARLGLLPSSISYSDSIIVHNMHPQIMFDVPQVEGVVQLPAQMNQSLTIATANSISPQYPALPSSTQVPVVPSQHSPGPGNFMQPAPGLLHPNVSNHTITEEAQRQSHTPQMIADMLTESMPNFTITPNQGPSTSTAQNPIPKAKNDKTCHSRNESFFL